jgi:hypothetical protein
MENEWRIEDIGRRGCSRQVVLYHVDQEGVCELSSQQYCAIWHAAAPMDTAFYPLSGGKLHVMYVGLCNRGDG